MSHGQMVFIVGIILLMLLFGLVGCITWLWELCWKPYDKLQDKDSAWSRYEQATRARRSSQTRGHV